jgi:hypothetical protein
LDQPFIPFARPAVDEPERRLRYANEIDAIAERALQQVRSKRVPLSTRSHQERVGLGPQEPAGANVEASV